jgi:hypothetical protein
MSRKIGQGRSLPAPGQLYGKDLVGKHRPTCLHCCTTCFWKRFNTMGATFSIYGGLIMAVLLMTFS